MTRKKTQYQAPTAADWPEVFRTVHGSHLYGLAHERSDQDTYIVTASPLPLARQTIDGDDDRFVVGVYAFLRKALSGSHQSLEAVFSPYKQFTEAGAAWAPLIDGVRVTSGDAMYKYERTIRRFSFGDFKRRRHAVRLSFNLASLRAGGRFCPVMTDEQIDEANRLATDHSGAELAHHLVPGVPMNAES